MIKRRRVYICDHCGAEASEAEYLGINDIYKDATQKWTKLGKEDLCPTCSKVYKRFVKEIHNDQNN